jgi:hypothetical protein
MLSVEGCKGHIDFRLSAGLQGEELQPSGLYHAIGSPALCSHRQREKSFTVPSFSFAATALDVRPDCDGPP